MTKTNLKHSQEGAFMGKSQPADPSNVVALRGLCEGVPNSVNGKVPPRRIPNKHRRTREYLTERYPLPGPLLMARGYNITLL